MSTKMVLVGPDYIEVEAVESVTPRMAALAAMPFGPDNYAKQGRENPSREAYDSLQRQLLRDLYAGDYGFVYSARVGDEWVTTGETCGFGFDWADADGISLEEIARELWEGHCEDEAVQNVAAVCKRLVEKADQLREVAALLEDKA